MKTLFHCVILLLATALLPAWSQAVPASNQKSVLPEGIDLPRTGMAFAIDSKSTGAQLVQLHATEIVMNSHAAGNYARSAIYVGPHSSVEIKGLNSAVNVTNPNASFIVRINSDDPELMRQRIHLIRLDQTKDRRVVSTFSQNIFGGQHSKKYNDIAITKTDAEPDLWLRVTPQSPLAPGEYAILFMPKDANLVPESIYDFNVAIDTAKPEKH